MKEKNTPRTGKMKVLIGSFTLLIVFLSPYLNITQFSLSMNLLQNAFISLLFLSFWILAAYLLRIPYTARNTISSSKESNTVYQNRSPSL